MADAITMFVGANRFLSNFYLCEIEVDGKVYPSTEHAYQAQKTTDKGLMESIRLVSSPGRAKRLGGKIRLREDWDQVKDSIMLDVLRKKFAMPHLREKLLATGDQELVEGNTWGDVYWGCVEEDGKVVGKNMLGKLLMQVRAECQADGSKPV